MAGSVFGGNTSAMMWAQVLLAAHKYHMARPPVPAPDKNSGAVSQVAKSDATKAAPKPTEDEPTVNSDTPSDDGPPASSTDGDSDGGAVQTKAPAYPQSVPPIQPVARPQPPVQPKPRVVSRPVAARDDDSNYVEVQVCADTGMLASIYCPETVTRRFRKGTEPKQTCRLHTGG